MSTRGEPPVILHVAQPKAATLSLEPRLADYNDPSPDYDDPSELETSNNLVSILMPAFALVTFSVVAFFFGFALAWGAKEESLVSKQKAGNGNTVDEPADAAAAFLAFSISPEVSGL